MPAMKLRGIFNRLNAPVAAAALVVPLFLVSSGSALAACWSFQPGYEQSAYKFVQVFGGPRSNDVFSDVMLTPWDTDSRAENLIGVAGGAAITDIFCGALTFEWEAYYGFHWNDQEFSEFGLAINSRWNEFPWDHIVDTSFAIGIGPSYKTKKAAYEVKDNGTTSKWLNQFNVEYTMADPTLPDWQLLLRLQHRSGAFGAIDGVEGGSNFLTFGIRHQF